MFQLQQAAATSKARAHLHSRDRGGKKKQAAQLLSAPPGLTSPPGFAPPPPPGFAAPPGLGAPPGLALPPGLLPPGLALPPGLTVEAEPAGPFEQKKFRKELVSVLKDLAQNKNV